MRLSRRRLPIVARMQVYLPEELYRQVKDAKLPVSEILQGALRQELLRRDKVAALDEFLAERAAEIPEPTPEDYAEAERIVAEIRGHIRKAQAS